MTVPMEQIRNIGIIAHIDAGKTTTTERVLYYTKASHRMGNVDEGTTETDFDEEEAKRGITIYSAAVTCHWHDTKINLIDTPGHVDFTAEVERSLRVLDGGVVIFSAVEGVEAQSETVWRQADKYHVPRICFINKMDRIGASFERTLQQMTERLQSQPVALNIPIGAGPSHIENGFRGIIDLIEMKALYFDSETRGENYEVAEIPEEMLDQAKKWRARLIETVALLDDEVLATYMETEEVQTEQIHKLLRLATLHNQLQPTFCGASLDYIGVQPLLNAVAAYLPSPLDVPPIRGEHPNPKKQSEPQVRHADPQEPFAGLIFKIQADQHTDLSFLRIYSGTLKSGSRMLNPRTGKKELVSQLWQIQANSRNKIEQAQAGDIVGVVGLKEVVTGDTLCDANKPVLLESIVFPETVISMAVEPESSAERKKLADTLLRLARQDPTFNARISEETGQTIISGMGELHLEVIRERIQRDFGLNVKVHKPRVSYRETVAKAAENTGVFSRPSATGALYAQVKIKLEPFEGESAVTIENKMKPGTLPVELEKILLESVNDEATAGGTVGYPLMKVKFTVLDADYREGETNEIAIQAATAEAIRKALHDAGIVLLEPIMLLEVTTPDDFLGNIQADLNSRRAVIVSSERRGELSVMNAEVPLAQMFGYSTQVRSLSQGRASYSMEPLRYAPAPPEVLKDIMG